MQKLSQLDIRIPAWDHSALQPRGCVLCGEAPTPRFERPDRLQVGGCPGCGLWFVSPAPTDAALTAFYSHYDRDHRREAALPAYFLAGLIRSLDPHDNPHVQLLREVLGDLSALRCLEVGFGRGVLLRALQEMGATATGVELDDAMVDFTRRHLQLQTFHGTAADLPAAARFDLICMVDLIEHPLDPVALMDQCVARLAPGGSIYLLTPNGTHLDQEEDPVALRVDLEHMQYFTTASMQTLAHRFALTVVHLDEWGHPELRGIDQPVFKPSIWKLRLAHLAYSLPGGTRLRSRRDTRRAAEATAAATRNASGRYHLRAILRKRS